MRVIGISDRPASNDELKGSGVDWQVCPIPETGTQWHGGCVERCMHVSQLDQVMDGAVCMAVTRCKSRFTVAAFSGLVGCLVVGTST